MSSPPTDRFDELRVEVDGEVETQNTDGVVRGTVERFPPSLFLRDTALTQADAAIAHFAEDIRAADGGDDARRACTRLLDRLTRMAYDARADRTTADAMPRKPLRASAASAGT